MSNHLSDMTDVFDLTNLVKETTCFKSKKGTLIDVLLTNKPKRFQKTQTFVTGLSDCHKLTLTILRSFFKKLPPKTITYRDHKKFDQNSFLCDLDNRLIQGEIYKEKENPYKKLTQILKGSFGSPRTFEKKK